MTLTPAYGRDYKSKKAIEEAFNNNVDFIIADITNPYNGKPVNKSDLMGTGVREVFVRYGMLRKIAAIKVK